MLLPSRRSPIWELALRCAVLLLAVTLACGGHTDNKSHSSGYSPVGRYHFTTIAGNESIDISFFANGTFATDKKQYSDDRQKVVSESKDGGHWESVGTGGVVMAFGESTQEVKMETVGTGGDLAVTAGTNILYTSGAPFTKVSDKP
jgi:hypothetical protein